MENKDTDKKKAEEIREKVLGYIEAWYEGDPGRGENCLHPDLVKRIVLSDPESGKDYLDLMTTEKLIDRWRSGDGRKTPVGLQLKNITILDVHGNIASVKLETPAWVDYMHLAKYNGEWVVVNILWERKP